MSKNLLVALFLIAAIIIILILNAGPEMSVSFRLFSIQASKSVMLFSFTGIGVIIGLLLK